MSPLEVSNTEVLVGLSFAFVLMGVYGYVTFRLDRHVRRKGYQSPFRGITMSLACLVVFFLAFDSALSESCGNCSPATNPEYYQPELLWGHVWRFVLRFSAVTTLGMVAIAGIALAVPRRARCSGRRRVRVPWQAVAYVGLSLIPISLLLVWLWGLAWRSAWHLIVLCYGLYAGSSYLAKQMRATGMKKAIQDDPRPPVLYLRAFDSEDEMFAALSSYECTQLGVPMLNLQGWRHPATLEEYFAQEIKRSIGPFIALGDPHDYLPPGGAEREYFADDSWQDVFRVLSVQSKFMLMKPERASNLLLELQLIRDSGLLGKLFIVTSPPPSRWLLPRSWSIYSERKNWNKFAADLKSIGLQAGDYPDRGAVVGFDLDGMAVLIAANSRTPAEYISAVRRRCLESSSSTQVCCAD